MGRFERQSVDGARPGLAVIRPTCADGDAVWALFGRCRETLEAVGIDQWDAMYPSHSIVDADLVAGRVSALSDGTRLIAVVSVGAEPELEYAAVPWTSAEPVRFVHRLCVDPAERGRGYAHLLMDFIERAATNDGVASIRLDAYSRNPAALNLYRHRGYRDVGLVSFPRRRAPFVCLERNASGAPMAADRG